MEGQCGALISFFAKSNSPFKNFVQTKTLNLRTLFKPKH